MIRALEFSVPTDQAVAFLQATLRITWDQRAEPSVEAPISLFYGTGTFFNRDKNREYLVKAFPVHVKYGGNRVRMACYFPMPFFREAKIELIGNGEIDFSGIDWSVRHEHRGMGRRGRLLGRTEHDPAVRRPPGGRPQPQGGEE
jgi:hypothetical protein